MPSSPATVWPLLPFFFFVFPFSLIFVCVCAVRALRCGYRTVPARRRRGQKQGDNGPSKNQEPSSATTERPTTVWRGPAAVLFRGYKHTSTRRPSCTAHHRPAPTTDRPAPAQHRQPNALTTSLSPSPSLALAVHTTAALGVPQAHRARVRAALVGAHTKPLDLVTGRGRGQGVGRRAAVVVPGPKPSFFLFSFLFACSILLPFRPVFLAVFYSPALSSLSPSLSLSLSLSSPLSRSFPPSPSVSFLFLQK